MAKAWIEVERIKIALSRFFDDRRQDAQTFGQTVNQTFEAFVFASVIGWYKAQGWIVQIENAIDEPTGEKRVRLKFSTRGRPDNYTYAVCTKETESCQIRHQLRVATKAHRKGKDKANVVLDIAVIQDLDLKSFDSDTFCLNKHLVTFGEVKHMMAFAELIVNAIGLVHELQPKRLKRNSKGRIQPAHLPPFLYVSGDLYPTAQGVKETIERRGFDIRIFDRRNNLPSEFST